MIRTLILGALTLMPLTTPAAAQFRRLETGKWRAALDVTGTDSNGKPINAGQLPFTLELARGERGIVAWIVNGEERIDVPRTQWAEGELTLSIDYFDSTIRARASDDGKTLEGEWTKRRGAEKWGTMRFTATSGEQPLFSLPPAKPERGSEPAEPFPLAQRWRVNFEGDLDPAVGIFTTNADGTIAATFLTTTGDYRYLAGEYRDNRLQLSVFDGSHAFLITAKQTSPGTIEGEFHSGNWSRSRWTAVADENAALPDNAWTITKISEEKSLADSTVKTLDGLALKLNDPRVLGTSGTVFEIFGTWCPNCLDATRLMRELHDKHSAGGIKFVGLAFEITGDEMRDRDMVRLYAERHDVPYLMLLAGVADKKKAAEALPAIDRVKAYPTFLFVDRAGKIKSVYTGFNGPATRDEHTKMRAEFEKRIAAMLNNE